MNIKSFKGKLADGGMDKIRLGTNDGLTGYKIRKLEIIPANPGGAAVEQVVKVHLEEPASVTGTVNFNNPLLLAVAYIAVNSDNVGIVTQIISFDHVKFNQDIFPKLGWCLRSPILVTVFCYNVELSDKE